MEKLTLKRGKGRPKNPNKKIEIPFWKLTFAQRHVILAKKYLEMKKITLTKTVSKDYFLDISNTPEEEFKGVGWDIYKSKLQKYEYDQESV